MSVIMAQHTHESLLTLWRFTNQIIIIIIIISITMALNSDFPRIKNYFSDLKPGFTMLRNPKPGFSALQTQYLGLAKALWVMP